MQEKSTIIIDFNDFELSLLKNSLRVNGEVIGKKVEGFTSLDAVVFDTSYRMRIFVAEWTPVKAIV